jgi:glycerophosphoryl diester phosphodiesterase
MIHVRMLQVNTSSRGLLALVTIIACGACREPPRRARGPRPPRLEIIAHRRVHQTFHGRDLKADTCTATRIDPPRHRFLENTLPSMAEAFRHGATMIELDVHRTSDDHLVVFHDWTLDCRTDGTGETRSRPLAYLRGLDLGYGYTADGLTFPFRGQGRGLLRTLEEVLAAFPRGRFLVNQKDADLRTARLLGRALARLAPARRRDVAYWGLDATHAELLRHAPEVRRLAYTGRETIRCLAPALLLGLTRGLSAACRRHGFAVPLRHEALPPGWPEAILPEAARLGLQIYLAGVDTAADAARVARLPVAGVITDRIEVVGPLVRAR